MNNPESQFLSPLRAQPLKKQRGGSTPTQFGGRNHNNHSSNSHNAAGPPAASAAVSSSSMESAGDAIARRRAELRRLQAQREARSAKRPEVTGPSTVLNSNTNTKTGNGPPVTAVPQPSGSPLRHHSDLFPTVPKSPTTNKTATVPALARPPSSGSGLPLVPKPPKGSKSTIPPPPPPLPSGGGGGGGGGGGTTVNRKLEYSSSGRAKSAPPARPPPPPPKASGGATTGSGSGTSKNITSKEAPSRVQGGGGTAPPPPKPPPNRRPPPVSPQTLLTTGKASSTTTNESVIAPPPQPSDNVQEEDSESFSVPETTVKDSTSNAEEEMNQENDTSRNHNTAIAAMDSNSSTAPTPKAPPPTSSSSSNKPPVVLSASGPPPTKEIMARTPMKSEENGTGSAPSTFTTSSSTPATTKPPPTPETTDAKTPLPVQTPATMAPPSTSRRDKIKSLRDGLGDGPASQIVSGIATVPSSQSNTTTTTSSSLQSETAHRLEQVLKETMDEKKQALQQITKLEQELLEARKQEQQQQQQQRSSIGASPSTPQPKALQKMLQVADTQGEQAALQWARSQVVGVPPLSLSSNEHLLGSPTAARTTRLLLDDPRNVTSSGGGIDGTGTGGNSTSIAIHRRRFEAPKPQFFGNTNDDNDNENDNNDATNATATATAEGQSPPSMVVVEKQALPHFREAAKCIPYRYDSSLATYIIRRPYGMETEPELFDYVSETSHAQYSKRAHVSTLTTIEVAGTVKATGSHVLLHDVAGIRYQNDYGEWKVVENVDALDRPSLGSITYLDNDGVERDYSLDQLVEEALIVREQYGRTLTTTALGFKERGPIPASSSVSVSPPKEDGTPKPETATVAVDTSDIPYPPDTIEIQKEQHPKHPDPTKPGTATSEINNKESSKEESSNTGTGDVLAIFLGMVFRHIFGLIYWIIIGFPLAIVRTTMVSAGVIAVLAMIYLYLLEEYHNGQSISLLSTTAYHSNAAGLGIL